MTLELRIGPVQLLWLIHTQYGEVWGRRHPETQAAPEHPRSTICYYTELAVLSLESYFLKPKRPEWSLGLLSPAPVPSSLRVTVTWSQPFSVWSLSTSLKVKPVSDTEAYPRVVREAQR